NCIKGLVVSVQKAQRTRAPALMIMILVNAIGIVYAPVYVMSNFESSNCDVTSLAFKTVMHMFFTSFGVFLVFKSWVVSQQNNKSSQLCLYSQDQLSSIGFLTGDLLIDLFCTLVTLYCAFRDSARTSSKIVKLYRVLVAENVLISTVNCVMVYYAVGKTILETKTDGGSPDLLLVMPSILNYVYAAALNAEFFWMALRSDALKDKSDDATMRWS
ncbi:hypothetical protein HDU81_010024, partial [Chytriomyces hyalinus]